MAKDWFRNERWDDDIAGKFNAKLKRAHKKDQYLRIQAAHIRFADPRVALQLLDEFFSLEDKWIGEIAPAWLQRAECYSQLGQPDEAIKAALEAVKWEKKFPNVITNVTLWLPLFIAENGRAELYDKAFAMLEARKRDIFPSMFFDRFAAKALIFEARGMHTEAREAATAALGFADRTRSFLSRHPTLGLVGKERHDLVRKMGAITSPGPRVRKLFSRK
jgi:tetratricopeptide (TPR) repeat protein